MAVGISEADRFRSAALNLESRISFPGRVPAPGYRQVRYESVVIERIRDDGAGIRPWIFEPGRPTLIDRIGIDSGRGWHDPKARSSRARNPPAMLHDGKAKRSPLVIIVAKILIVVDRSIPLLLQPGLGFLKFRRPRGTEKHRDGQTIILHG